MPRATPSHCPPPVRRGSQCPGEAEPESAGRGQRTGWVAHGGTARVDTGAGSWAGPPFGCFLHVASPQGLGGTDGPAGSPLARGNTPKSLRLPSRCQPDNSCQPHAHSVPIATPGGSGHKVHTGQPFPCVICCPGAGGSLASSKANSPRDIPAGWCLTSAGWLQEPGDCPAQSEHP